jgi:solute carrier family 23 (nucleobase transporter), member 1
VARCDTGFPALFLIAASCAAEAIILGFQHYIVMLGTSVIIPSALVPQMGGGNVGFPNLVHERKHSLLRVLNLKVELLRWWRSLLCQEEKARVVQTLLFVAGINTLCQSFFGTRLPAVMGGSYTVVAPTISIILAGRYRNETDPHQVAFSEIGRRVWLCLGLTSSL